ncbi:MAG: hypothetical protein AAGF13_09760 [Pseudomonadota bacterium]
MKQLVMIAALMLPVSALANAPDIEELEHLASFSITEELAGAPVLPLASVEDALACAMPVDPLPEVLTLHLGADERGFATLCLAE